MTLGNEFCIKAVVRASIGNPLIISTMIKSHRRELFIVVLFKVNVCMLEREEGERNLSQISAYSMSPSWPVLLGKCLYLSEVTPGG